MMVKIFIWSLQERPWSNITCTAIQKKKSNYKILDIMIISLTKKSFWEFWTPIFYYYLFLCSQSCSDFLVTFSLCTSAGFLVKYLFLPVVPFSFVCDMFELSEFGTLSRGIVGPVGRTSSPNSSCKSLVIASLTSKFFRIKSVWTLFTSKMMNISSFTDSPAAKIDKNVTIPKE